MKANDLSTHICKEMKYHNSQSDLIISKSKTDFIWQIPEKLIFNKYIDRKKNWTLLDLGCGSAENIKKNIHPLMTKNNTYIGVDVSKNLLQKAKENIPTGKFILQPMHKIEMKDKSIDYLCFFGSLHHDEFPEKTFKRVIKFLKPGGLIFLREPQEKAFKKGCGISPYEAGINPVNLKRCFENAKLTVLEWHFLNSYFFHLIRRFIKKFKLDKLENKESFWVVKTKTELLFERLLNGLLKNLQGTDMFIVAKK